MSFSYSFYGKGNSVSKVNSSSSSHHERSLLHALDAGLHTMTSISNPGSSNIHSMPNNLKRPRGKDKIGTVRRKKSNSIRDFAHLHTPSVSSSDDASTIYQQPSSAAYTAHRHLSSAPSPTSRYALSANSSSSSQLYSSSAASTENRSSSLILPSAPSYLRTTSQRIKRLQDSYTTTPPVHQASHLSKRPHSVYQGDYSDDSIEAFLRRTEPSSFLQSTSIPRAASTSTSTINNYIPTSKTKNRIDLTTTTAPSVTTEESIESHIARMDGKIYDHEPLYATPSRSSTPPEENDTAMVLLTETTSVAPLNESDDTPSEQQFKRKIDNDDNRSVAKAPWSPLKLDELFAKQPYKTEPTTRRQKKTRRRRQRRAKSLSADFKSITLDKIMTAIGTHVTEEETGLDGEQDWAFFGDETPKDNGPKQDLVNGFDGFSDADD